MKNKRQAPSRPAIPNPAPKTLTADELWFDRAIRDTIILPIRPKKRLAKSPPRAGKHRRKASTS